MLNNALAPEPFLPLHTRPHCRPHCPSCTRVCARAPPRTALCLLSHASVSPPPVLSPWGDPGPGAPPGPHSVPPPPHPQPHFCSPFPGHPHSPLRSPRSRLGVPPWVPFPGCSPPHPADTPRPPSLWDPIPPPTPHSQNFPTPLLLVGGGGTHRPPIPPYPIPRTPRSPPASTALIDTPWIPPPSPIPPKGTPWPPHLCPGPPQPHPGMPGSGCGCPWLSMARASLSHCRAGGGGLRGAPSLTHRRRQPLYSLGLQQGHVTPCPPPSAGAQQRLGGPGWESHMGGRGGTSVRGAQGDAGAPQGWEGGVGGWGGRAR